MQSTLLYHGPGARGAALAEGGLRGRLVAPPFGDEGLKVDEAREIVRLLRDVPLGNHLGVVVAGPIDEATPDSCDVLLKSIEQPFPAVLPILWAHDLGDVSPTVRSRCLQRWAPTLADAEDESLEEAGRDLLDAVLSNQLHLIPSVLYAHGDRLHALLGVVADAVVSQATPETLGLWERLRSILRWKNLTPIEALAAFLPEVS